MFPFSDSLGKGRPSYNSAEYTFHFTLKGYKAKGPHIFHFSDLNKKGTIVVVMHTKVGSFGGLLQVRPVSHFCA